MNDQLNANVNQTWLASFLKKTQRVASRSLPWRLWAWHLIFTSVFVIYFHVRSDTLENLILILCFTSLSFLVSLKMYLSFVKDIERMNSHVQKMHAEQFNNKIYTQMPEEFSDLVDSYNMLAKSLKAKLKNVRAEHHQLDVVLSSMVDGVIALDKKQKVLLINDAAKRLFQIQDEELLGQQLWKKIRYPQVNQVIDDVFRFKTYQRGQFSLAHEKGEIVAELLGSSIIDEHNNFLGAVLVIQDISRQKQFEKIRRDFVANASHDLKTPIAAITAMVETMQDDPDMPAETKKSFTDKIQRQTQRLQALVKQLMTLSEAEAIEGVEQHHKSTFDVCELAAQLVEDLTPLLEKKSLSMSFNTTQETIFVNADREAIEQALQNLLDNAIKYTEQGSLNLSVYQQDKNVVVSVQDSGEGISEHDQERIFERFYRVDKSRTSQSEQPTGSGLGLAIVKHVVEKHSGEVSVTSRLGAGSTFKIRLPL